MRNMKSGKTIAERLEYYSMPEPNSGCQIWIGSVSSSGYGSIGNGKSGRLIRSHKAAWELKNGSVPSGLVVCHHCDNKLCINPDHLFVGTVADNNRDMVRKGRHRPMARAIPDSAVLELRSGALATRVAMARYGVTASVVSNARNGKNGYSRVRVA